LVESLTGKNISVKRTLEVFSALKESEYYRLQNLRPTNDCRKVDTLIVSGIIFSNKKLIKQQLLSSDSLNADVSASTTASEFYLFIYSFIIYDLFNNAFSGSD
jgi:hypothetical protein